MNERLNDDDFIRKVEIELKKKVANRVRKDIEVRGNIRAAAGGVVYVLAVLGLAHLNSGPRFNKEPNQVVKPQPAHEEVVRSEVNPRVEGDIVYNRELRLSVPGTDRFQRFVMPEGIEEIETK